MMIADAQRRYGDDLVRRALQREVTETRFGWRVEYNRALDGDYEFEVTGGKPRAYWPKQRADGTWFCRCRHGRARNPCSHVLAVRLRLVD